MIRFVTAFLLLISLFASAWAGNLDMMGLSQTLGVSPTGVPGSAIPALPIAAPPQSASNIMAPLAGPTGSTGVSSMLPAAVGNASASAPVSTATGVMSVSPPFDYSVNLNSDTFGAQLFTGAFARQGYSLFNPDYVIMIGDRIDVRLWGAFEYESALVVDAQGNIFLPHVGPLHVVGTRNQDLQNTIESAVRRVFRANVYSYASLAAAQPVRVFVGGFVYRPGLYNGTSMDSLLHYLDLAGGVDPSRGSFLDVQIKRNGQIRAEVNLYDFLLDGRIPLVQLSDGDVIFVAPRQNTVLVRGLVENAKRFEFSPKSHTVADVSRLAKPTAAATHVRISRNTGPIVNVEYYPIDQSNSIRLVNGDNVEFTADKKPGTISVRVEGEHFSPQEYVLPYGSRMGSLISQIQFNERSDRGNIQLFRVSVHDRQKEMLETSLKRLETAVLTARSGTAEESQLRVAEANLILQWIERAKTIEPTGQVVIAQSEKIDDLLLENGDIIRVPVLDNLVLVNGEVLFPNSVAYAAEQHVEDYIKASGGYSQSADTSRIVLAHRDGSYENIDEDWFSSSTVRPGDQIFVLPKVDVKSRQIMKEVATMIYQVALGARVVTSFR